MKNALILHGTGNNSQGNWFPWLKEELEKNGWKVWVPDLPGADKPSCKTYNEFLFGNKDWEFNSESVVIGHSSGAVELLSLLQHLLDDIVIDKAILIGSFLVKKEDSDYKDWEGLFEEPFDYEKIKKHAKQLIFIHSDNDPYCPLEGAKFLAEQTGGQLIVKEGQGHFNLEVGPQYKRFPFLLELLEK